MLAAVAALVPLPAELGLTCFRHPLLRLALYRAFYMKWLLIVEISVVVNFRLSVVTGFPNGALVGNTSLQVLGEGL